MEKKYIGIHVMEPFSWKYCEIASTKILVMIRWELIMNVAQ